MLYSTGFQYGPWTQSTSLGILLEMQILRFLLPRPTESEALGRGPGLRVLTSPPGSSVAHLGLTTTVLLALTPFFLSVS